ncbi:unnamed protein product [Rhizoctonia solani]|uniref:AIG1-type G domain-containing protein n=1 Tax=Rhizoctonia solani TaxID=456999 RepID=A0A8H2WLM8_9AGAM|nr:unnamed protein product [Rhizoctonia solani]
MSGNTRDEDPALYLPPSPSPSHTPATKIPCESVNMEPFDSVAEILEPSGADANYSGDRAGAANAPGYNGRLKLPKDKKSITIILVGETGCGKTAFMSLLLNLFKGRNALELEDLHHTSTDSGLSKSCSQTEKAVLYMLETPDQGFRVQILDTPGFGDSRGPEQEKINQKEINDAIAKLTEIDALIIMSNGTTERLGKTTDYTLKTLMTLFPRSILGNIGFVFTNVSPLSFNFQEDSLPPDLQKSESWTIQNPLALLIKHNSLLKNDSRFPLRAKQALKTIEHAYDDVIETLDQWLEWVNSRPAQPTNEIVKIYEKYTQLQSRLDNVMDDITKLYQEREQWQTIKNELQSNKSHKQTLKKLRDQAKMIATTTVILAVQMTRTAFG